jgi:hypothetical protein
LHANRLIYSRSLQTNKQNNFFLRFTSLQKKKWANLQRSTGVWFFQQFRLVAGEDDDSGEPFSDLETGVFLQQIFWACNDSSLHTHTQSRKKVIYCSVGFTVQIGRFYVAKWMLLPIYRKGTMDFNQFNKAVRHVFLHFNVKKMSKRM